MRACRTLASLRSPQVQRQLSGEMYMTQKLFVYGTLAPGRPNAHVLGAIGGTWQPATVKGHLKQRGWGAEMGYPGLVLDKAGEEIKGFIFSISRPPDSKKYFFILTIA